MFLPNGIQTMSGYCYNLGNNLAGMARLGRYSAAIAATLDEIARFRANEEGQSPLMVAKGNETATATGVKSPAWGCCHPERHIEGSRLPLLAVLIWALLRNTHWCRLFITCAILNWSAHV